MGFQALKKRYSVYVDTYLQKYLYDIEAKSMALKSDRSCHLVTMNSGELLKLPEPQFPPL